MRKAVMRITVRPEIARYALQIVRGTRENPFLRAGASAPGKYVKYYSCQSTQTSPLHSRNRS